MNKNKLTLFTTIALILPVFYTLFMLIDVLNNGVYYELGILFVIFGHLLCIPFIIVGIISLIKNLHKRSILYYVNIILILLAIISSLIFYFICFS